MQIVPDSFHEAAQRGIRAHTWGFRASFTKEFDDDVEFAMWDVSDWDGGDLWSPPEDNPIQAWDFYDYSDYTDRVVEMEWNREIDFPYSVHAAMADFTLNNYDNYFTPGQGSPIDGYILPKRPVRLYAGFRGQGLLQQFVGITQGMPILSSQDKRAIFHALDFLSEMYAMPLTETVAMSNVTTDEVLAKLFEQFGLAETQYSLALGRNRIPFVFFERGKNAGNAFRELMQAEGGNLWIDEQGIIRFEQRLLPIQDPVMLFNDSNVEHLTLSTEAEIINTVRIRSNIRAVQPFQVIYDSSDELGNTTFIEPLVIPASSSLFVPIDLTDPLLTVSMPTIGEKVDDSWFSVIDGDGNPVASDVSITLEDLRTNNYVMLFENDNAFPVQITRIQIWGEPARIVDELQYEAYDEDSVSAYGELVLGGDTIQNNFFGSESNAESFALTIIDAYKDFGGVIELSVKGDPSLQLGDIIEVDTRDVSGNYKVIKINEARRDSRATTILRASKYTPREWAFWDVSLWDGGDLWSP